jgi:hypothetical protein
MPGCRRSSLSSTFPATGQGLRLSRYLQSGRHHPHASNDNRRLGSPGFWHWAAALGVVPLVSFALILTMLS